MIAARYWLMLGTAVGMVASAGQTLASQPPVPPPPPTSPEVPDGEFIEFLGADDHGDVAWWEMLKQVPAGSQKPAAPPPKDSSS